jgi:hypothetical protein
MGNIEQARLAAHGQVLIRDACVMDRHLPATEFDKSRSEPLVCCKKRSVFQYGPTLLLLLIKGNPFACSSCALFTPTRQLDFSIALEPIR